jgi:AAA domain
VTARRIDIKAPEKGYGKTLCMSGKAGELAKWTVRENDHGNPSLWLVKYVPFLAATVRPKIGKSLSEVPKTTTQRELRLWPQMKEPRSCPVLGDEGHYCRKFLSATIGQSGKGKTSRDLMEAVSFACGKNLFNDGKPFRHGPLNVWYWNLEDPREESERRALAIMAFYNLRDKDIGDRLIINSGRDQTLAIAEPGLKGGIHFVEPLIDAFIKEGKRLKTDPRLLAHIILARMTIWLLMPLRSAGPPLGGH